MAVYTDVSDVDLRGFLADYDVGDVVSFHGIAEGVENSNFLVVTDQGPHILTLYEKRVDPTDLPFFIALMQHLAAKGFACPQPIAARDGVTLRRLNGRPAALVTFLRGMWPRRVEPRHCAEIGRGLARLHLAGGDFAMSRANNLSVDAWRGLYEPSRAEADSLRPGLARTIEAELEALERDWPSGLPAGVVHADLFPDNAFFEEEALSGIIDFYFACTDALAYDLAICLNAWCFEADGALNVTKARALTAGYHATRPLSAEEIGALPLLARGSAMRFLLTRLHDWLNHPPGAFVKPKDPLEYWRRLLFHSRVRSSAAYGLDFD